MGPYYSSLGAAQYLSLGLAPVVVKRLVPVLGAIAGSGVGVLLIEQFAHVALGLANTAYILEGGRIRYHGTASELPQKPELLHSAYLLRLKLDGRSARGCVRALCAPRSLDCGSAPLWSDHGSAYWRPR